MEDRCQIVVGVIPQQNDRVVSSVKRLARALQADVVFVYADAHGYQGAAGHASSLDPDLVNGGFADNEIREGLEARLGRGMEDSDSVWKLVCCRGSAGQALAQIAQEVDAELIVIGDREEGPKAVMRETVGGKVASILVRIQPRPVVIVPQHPKLSDREDAGVCSR